MKHSFSFNLRRKNPTQFLFLIIIIILNLESAQPQTLLSNVLSIDSPSAGITTILTFDLKFTSSASLGACVFIDFPNPYTGFDPTYGPIPSSISCSGGANQICNQITKTRLSISFKSTGSNFFGTGINFVNPYSEVTFGNIITSYSPNCNEGNLAATTVTSTLPSFTRGTISVTSITSSSTMVGQTTADLTFTFSPGGIQNAGFIDLIFPAWYSINTVESTTPMLSISSPTGDCTKTVGTITVDQCTISTRTLTVQFSGYSSSATVGISVKNFKNPVNRFGKQGFQIRTKDQGGNVIAESTNTLTLSTAMTTPTAIGIPSFSFQNNVVSTFTSFTLTFTYPIPTELNCYIQITFPSDLPIDQGKITGYSATGFFDNAGNSILNPTFVNWSGQTMKVEACKNAANIATSTTVGPAGSITITQLQVPNQVKQTDPFTIQTYQSNDYLSTSLIAQGSFVVPASAIQAGTISLTQFIPRTPVEYEVQFSGATFSIRFTPQHQLFSTSKIIIMPPTGLTTTSCTYFSGGGTITGAPTCTFSAGGWEITNVWTNSDGNSLTPDYLGNAEISIQMGQGTNPLSEQSAGTWSVKTQNLVSGSFYDVDSGSSPNSYSTTSGQITPILIGSSSTTTGASNAIYTFTLNSQHSIPSGGFVDITYPSSVSVVGTSTCQFGVAGMTSSTCNDNGTRTRITITTGFDQSTGSLKLTIGPFQNPRTYQPTGSFTFTSYDSSLKKIDSGNGLSLVMDTKGLMNAVTVTSGSQVNGATTTYTISFTSSLIQVRNGDIFFITFPSEITLSLASCSAGSQISNIICVSPSANALKATLVSLISNTGTFSFTVSSARNAPSWRPSSTFTNIFTTDSNGYHSIQFTNNILVTNTIAGTITTATITQSTYLANTPATFTITFNPVNRISTTGKIVMTYPPQVTIASNAACQVQTSSLFTDKCVIDTSAKTITIENVFPSTYSGQVRISVVGTTPLSNSGGMGNFFFTTYDDSAMQFKIDELTQANSQLFVQLECNYPCKTCSTAISKDFCTSCWDAPEPSYLQITSPTLSTCQIGCNTGYTSNGSTNPKLCVKCDATCETCEDKGAVGDLAKCITCSASFNFKVGQYSCQTACPGGYYNSGVLNNDNICLPCTLPCVSCSTSATVCTACDQSSSTPILFNGGCLNTCPPGYTNVNQQCVACTSPCLSCAGSTNLCTSCDNTLSRVYLFAATCYQTCPSGTVANTATLKCDGCQTGCDKCDLNNQKICLSCTNPLVNFEGVCQAACPNGYELTADRACKPLNIISKPEVVVFNNTVYIPGETIVKYINVTTETGEIITYEIKNTTYTIIDLPLIYFPHLIAAGVCVIISVGGYLKDRQHVIITNIILLVGPIELISYGVQCAFAYLQTNDIKLVIIPGISFIAKIILNLAFFIFYSLIIKNDPGFQLWRTQHKHGSRCVACCGCSLSFKMFKLFYSFFYGFDNFNAAFDNPKTFQIMIIVFTCVNWVFSYIPILFIDISSLANTNKFKWGSQLYITMIETALLSTLIFILSLIELFFLNKLIGQDPTYKKVVSDSMMEGQPMETLGLDSEKENRKEALNRIMGQIKGNRDLFLNNKLDELLNKFGDRRCQSMGEWENDKEDDPRRTRSYPMTPRGYKDYDDVNFRPKGLPPPDNVYAESKPRDPMASIGKEFADAQLQAYDIPAKVGLDLPVGEDSDDEQYKRRRNKKNRRRGRKSDYYNQIDFEDDEEAGFERQLLGRDHDPDLEVIKEEDEDIKKKVRFQKEQEREEEQKRLEKEQEKLRLEVEKRLQREQEERRLKEEEKKRAEEEKKRRDEDEKRKKEEERKRKEEEKKKKEEEERLRKEEEKRKKEEERIKKEEEKKRKEEEERKRKEEEKRKKEEAIRKAKEEKERKERELKEYEEKIEQERIQREQKEKEEKRKKKLEEEQMLQKLEEERMKQEKEEQERKMKEELDAKNLEQQIFQEEKVKGQGSPYRNPYEDHTIESRSRPYDEVEPGLPIPKRPPTAGAKSDHPTQSQEVLIGRESLWDFNKKEPIVEAPPNSDKRNFNENDILGDFDRDEKGNVIVLQDKNENFLDKQGRLVNPRGYLLDPKTGDVIENENQNKMFDSKDMDDRGEVPAPFCVEKYNFNPHNIRGDLDQDKYGNWVLQKNKRGEYIDKKGKRVNRKGYLIDGNGNIIDKNGRKKFDKKQLNLEENLPKLYNYNGRRFDILDTLGQFDKDATGNALIRVNQNGEYIDNKGRKVNEKGYLIDDQGNIIDKGGKKIFEKKHLKNGEFPKIFPFTRFNVQNVLGTFEMDPLSNPMLDKNKQGELIDKDGRKVNQRGYLIDKDGNIIDKRGKKMFDKEILDKDGEIPKVFRTGLLKSDTESSLSRLMSEIERNQPSEGDNEEKMIQRELAKLQASINKSPKRREEGKETQRKNSGNTSVDSQMEDTPSNYNLANQRFDHLRDAIDHDVEQIEEVESDSDLEGLGAISSNNMELKKKRRKRKKKLYQKYEIFVEPGEKDKKMARAYGGQAMPKKITKMVPMSHKSKTRLRSPSQVGPLDDQNKLSKLTNAIGGFQDDRGGVDISQIRGQFESPDEIQNQFYPQKEIDSQRGISEYHRVDQSLGQSRGPDVPRKRRRTAKNLPKQSMVEGEQEFEKMFGKDIDKFLDDSEWDINSFENMSQLSSRRSNLRSAMGDGRIRGLESIYLQRLETSQKRRGQFQSNKGITSRKKPKFRVMQDRFVDDPQQLVDDEQNLSFVPDPIKAQLRKKSARNY